MKSLGEAQFCALGEKGGQRRARGEKERSPYRGQRNEDPGP